MVRVIRAAAVLEQPVGDARSVGAAGVGELLDVLDARSGWYLVRPSAGSSVREWRTGWINALGVEPMDRGTGDGSGQKPTGATSNGEPTANRKGFIVGAGAGAGLHRTPGFAVFDRFGRVTSFGSGTNNFSVVTNFLIGYAPTDRALLYYSNRATFTTDERYDALGVTGVGMTYMLRRTAPTGYITGSIGGGFGTNLSQRAAGDVGLGWTVGGGWEFKRHWSLEGDALFVRLGNSQNHTVYRGLMNYVFY